MSVISSGIFRISSGETSSGLEVIQTGIIQVLNGGWAETVSAENGGSIVVSNGGILYICTVSSGGTATVLNGGYAQEVTVENSGLYLVSSGGTAHQSLIQSGGKQIVYADVMAASATVLDGGVLEASSGAYVRVPVVSQGGVLQVWNGALVDGARISGLVEVNSKATVNSTAVLDGGKLAVLTGGYAYEARIGSGGTLDIFSGGRANYASVFNGGAVTVSAGASCLNTELNGGCITLAGAIHPADPETEAVPGGFASNTMVNSGGALIVSNGATATKVKENGGYVEVLDGANVAFVANTVSGLALSDASATIHSGTTANSATVNAGGRLEVFSGGTATEVLENGGYVEISDGAAVTFASNTISGLELAGSATVHSGTTANKTTVNAGGRLEVFSGGTATEVKENGGYVEISEGASVTFASNTISGLELAGSATIHSGTTANSATVNAGGKLEVFSGGTANDITINSGGMAEVSSGVISGAVVRADGSLLIYDGTRITGRMVFESGAVVIPFVGSIMDFDLTQTGASDVALVNDLSILMGTPSYTLTVADAQAEGMYILADGAAKFDSTITVQNTLGETLGTLTVGETVKIGYDDYTLNLNEGALTLSVEVPPSTPVNLVGTADGVSWEYPAGADLYEVNLSTDDFGQVFRWLTDTTAQDLYELPGGTYQWRVMVFDDGENWAVGEDFVSENDPGTARVVQSNADGVDDIFFASANGTWSREYFAQHAGSLDEEGWTGTGEFVSANGKGRIQNLFFGSSDPSILCLTDGENGDAIFLDDVYTELPEELEANTARLLRIREIWAGAGDDIIDMTSQRFEYIGDGLTIRGGEGSDTIWANKGNNWLFGDAGNDRIVGASGNDVIAGGIGNDRMHGCGGDDVFTFCDNWGTDTVEQLATGSVTLWFASGDESNWNAETQTYTDGDNSVKVSGITADKITLKFGDDGSDQFATLSGMGAFFDATTERIFEESGKGILASL